MGLFDFLFANKDTSVQEKKEGVLPQNDPQYKEVSFITPDTSIPYYQWYKSFVHYKKIRQIVHNFGLKYDVYKYSLFLNSTDFMYHYINDHVVNMYGVKNKVPLCRDGAINYALIDLDTSELQEKIQLDSELGYKTDRGFHNPWNFLDLDAHDESRNHIDMLVNLLDREGYDISSSYTAMLITESLKYDAILAAYNKYKNGSEQSEDFLEQFFEERYEELFQIKPNNDRYDMPSLNYEKLAYISYVLYKQGSTLEFSSLEHLYELILKEKDKAIQESLLADNDPDNFEKSHDENAEEDSYDFSDTDSYSPFSSVPDVDVVTPYELEQMVEEQFTSMGYEAVATKKSGDQGADVIVKEPSTGLVTVVQVKQYFDSKVGNKAVQEVLAGKEFYDADRAIVMTTSYFTKSATELAEKTDVELMDRDDFLAFMS